METSLTLSENTMSAQEARECVDKINLNLNDTRVLILDLYERKGWKTLGYESWRKCVTSEFKGKQSYLYYQLEAAKTERNISTIVENKIPEGQLRPLTHLPPEEQREVWQKAVETAPKGKVTAKHVQKTINEMVGSKGGDGKKDSRRRRKKVSNLFTLQTTWMVSTKKTQESFIKWLKKGGNYE